MCNDLRLLSSGPRCGFNEINLPAAAPGSSIMPGKINPVIPEVMNQVCFQVIGTDHTIASASEAAQLQLNGHERFSIRDGDYFNWCQPYQHHTRVPYDHWVGMYSFCLSPEEHQPSGALNFSRIDNATLKLDFKPAGNNFKSGTSKQRAVYVYAVNYNVLRILSGMGGLAFSN